MLAPKRANASAKQPESRAPGKRVVLPCAGVLAGVDIDVSFGSVLLMMVPSLTGSPRAVARSVYLSGRTASVSSSAM